MNPDHTSPARAHRQTKRRHTLRHTLFFLILLLFALPQLHADDLRLNPVIRGLADGKSYEPGGANRLFSGARGNVQDRKNRLKPMFRRFFLPQPFSGCLRGGRQLLLACAERAHH